MQSIKDQYRDVCEKLIEQRGHQGTSYTIRPDASIEECLGYTKEYLLSSSQDGDNTSHFRYNRYLEVLDYALTPHPSIIWHIPDSEPLVHIDLGTGPGIFAWVMNDWAWANRSSKGWRPDIFQFGYDSCESMVELAQMIWTDVAVHSECTFTSEIDVIRQHIEQIIDQRRTISLVITLGHLLIQIADRDGVAELRDLSSLCAEFAAKTVGPTTVVAVDASTGNRRSRFERHVIPEFLQELNLASSSIHDDRNWVSSKLPNAVDRGRSRALISNWRSS